MSTPRRPEAQESNEYFKRYINLVTTDDIVKALRDQLAMTELYFKKWPADKWDYAYAEGKWTIKEVLIHLMDTERIMAYRALCIARNDQTALPPFDHNNYMPFTNAAQRSPASIMQEYRAVRQGTIAMFANLKDEDLARIGTFSGDPGSPLALAFIIAGHEIHHLQIIEERYKD